MRDATSSSTAGADGGDGGGGVDGGGDGGEQSEPLKDITEVVVGDCLGSDLTVVSCGDGEARYSVLDRLLYDSSAIQHYPDSPTYEAAVCARAGWDVSNSTGVQPIIVDGNREVLCLGDP